MIRRPPRSTRTDTLVPYTTLFRSRADCAPAPRPADSEPNLPPCLSHPDQKDCFADKKRLDKCDRSYKRRSRLMDGMGRMGLGTIDIVVVVVYAIAIFGLAQWVSREKAGHQKNTSDYFLASKNLPWWAIRPAARRVGNACVRPCRSRWAPY